MRHLLKNVRSLGRNQEGSVAVEGAIAIPFFLSLVLGGITVFDMLRMGTDLDANTSVVSDLISRESAVDNAKMETFFELQKTLTGVTDDANARLIVTAVIRLPDDNNGMPQYELTWQFDSLTKTSTKPLTDTFDMKGRPLLAVGESALFIDTTMKDKLIFSYEEPSRTLKRRVALTPRYLNHVENTDVPR